MGLRAAVWKATPNLPSAGFLTVVAWAALALVIMAFAQCAEAGGPARWSPYGFNALATLLVLMLVITAFFFRPEVRATAIGATLVILIISGLATIAYELVGLAVSGTVGQAPTQGLWTSAESKLLFYVVQIVWWAGATLAIFRSVDPRTHSSHLLPLAGLFIAMIVLGAALPHEPIFRASTFDIRQANLWEQFGSQRNGESNETPARTVASAAEAAKIERSQPALLEEVAAKLSPQRPGVTDIYAVGLAGWADQEVFRKELDGAFDAFSRSFGTQGRTLKLVNDPETVSMSPIATLQNFAAAVRSVGRVMDKNEDILLLLLTSHGDKRGVALQFSGLVYGGLTPEDVAAVLADEGIVNRIVIVSACYSGVFVKPLADFNTIVLTAADENSTSFGCSNDRGWTYFGDALFNQSLLPGRDLEHAFSAAKSLVGEWETRDGVSPSNPQAHFGIMLKEKLSTIYGFARNADGRNSTP
jgi:hypothetical protein